MKSKETEVSCAPLIFTDPLYLECIRLATLSKGAQQRYGSLLRLPDGTIAGLGYNRAIAHRSFGTLRRLIRQGYANHAEVEALNDALEKGYNVRGAEIFVGGYFPKENGLLFLQNEFTCVRCPPVLASYGVTIINVPTAHGWMIRTTDEALHEAGSYREGGTYKNRIESIAETWTIQNLEDSSGWPSFKTSTVALSLHQ